MNFISSGTSAHVMMQDYSLLLVIPDTELDFYVPGCLHWKLKNFT